MNRTKFFAYRLGVVLAILLLAGCAAPPAGPAATAPPAGPAATALPSATPARTPLPPPISAVFPTGIFVHQHAANNFCIYQFNQDGTFAYFWMAMSPDIGGREPYVRGTYATTGSLYTETVTSGVDCRWPGSYAWTYDGSSLAFQLIGEDKCADRQRSLESSLLWKKIE